MLRVPQTFGRQYHIRTHTSSDQALSHRTLGAPRAQQAAHTSPAHHISLLPTLTSLTGSHAIHTWCTIMCARTTGPACSPPFSLVRLHPRVPHHAHTLRPHSKAASGLHAGPSPFFPASPSSAADATRQSSCMYACCRLLPLTGSVDFHNHIILSPIIAPR